MDQPETTATPEMTAAAPTRPVTRHPLGLRLVHWLTAAVMAWMLLSGIGFWLLGYKGLVELLGNDVVGGIYRYHKTFGVIVLALVVLRLAITFSHPRPPELAELPRYQQVLGTVVHVALYAILIGMPVIGWLATAAGGYPVQFFQTNLPGLIGTDKELASLLFTLHWAGGMLAILLVGMHVGAGLFHKFIRKDGVFRRISLP